MPVLGRCFWVFFRFPSNGLWRRWARPGARTPACTAQGCHSSQLIVYHIHRGEQRVDFYVFIHDIRIYTHWGTIKHACMLTLILLSHIAHYTLHVTSYTFHITNVHAAYYIQHVTDYREMLYISSRIAVVLKPSSTDKRLDECTHVCTHARMHVYASKHVRPSRPYVHNTSFNDITCITFFIENVCDAINWPHVESTCTWSRPYWRFLQLRSAQPLTLTRPQLYVWTCRHLCETCFMVVRQCCSTSGHVQILLRFLFACFFMWSGLKTSSFLPSHVASKQSQKVCVRIASFHLFPLTQCK